MADNKVHPEECCAPDTVFSADEPFIVQLRVENAALRNQVGTLENQVGILQQQLASLQAEIGGIG